MFEFRKVICRFDVNKLLRMIEFYPNDFIDVSEVTLRHQLKNYITNVRSDRKFAKLKGLSDLCTKLVEANKCNTFQLQVLNVFFSDMKVVKSNLHNKMDDQWLNDRLVAYIESDFLLTISNDVILGHFQQIDRRRDFYCNVLYQTMLFLIFNSLKYGVGPFTYGRRPIEVMYRSLSHKAKSILKLMDKVKVSTYWWLKAQNVNFPFGHLMWLKQPFACLGLD
ncbi:hypothetical protein MTR_7g011160 [Medicago truncatula]|uniref:Uncharacterized protein n=1 Tax=Medicago truncatula TaxID=3880 RepID=G7L224_MEDTR|nr:hypothetical protein MTR_7g011160 [Medicago truncatula]